MKAPTQERSRRTLDRLLAAAVTSFADVGVDHATVAEIVGDAKSSVGSFYGRFSSKDDLVVAVDERLWAEVEDRWRSALLELAGVAAGGADPASDSVTELSLPIADADEHSTLDLSRAVFGALTPDLEARSRASAYLERHKITSQSIRVLAHIEADVLRALRGGQATDEIPSSGLHTFLTGVVLKTAMDPNVGPDAQLHLAHVLSRALDQPTNREPLPEQVTPEIAPEEAPEGPRPKPEAFDIWA